MQDTEVVIVGGGAIGLSIAYELAGRGVRVTVVERDETGRASSWAGAGIVTPAGTSGRPIDRLRALSRTTLAEWSQRLRDETGIDNEYLVCGGLEVAFTPDELPALESAARDWREQGVTVEEVPPERLHELEPILAPALRAQLLPDEAQLRNPRHVAALTASCLRRGVTLRTGTTVRGLVHAGGRVQAVATDAGPIGGDLFVVASGAWSAALLAEVGVAVAVQPVRGQIVLLAAPTPLLSRVLWRGARYLVPRRDGRVLVGSTEEEAGFDARPTAEGVRGLLELAQGMAPALAALPFERAWAGLRPGSPDTLPFLGPVPGYANLHLAAGHFRAGLELSAGTAVVMAQLLLGEEPVVPLDAFRVDRF